MLFLDCDCLTHTLFLDKFIIYTSSSYLHLFAPLPNAVLSSRFEEESKRSSMNGRVVNVKCLQLEELQELSTVKELSSTDTAPRMQGFHLASHIADYSCNLSAATFSKELGDRMKFDSQPPEPTSRQPVILRSCVMSNIKCHASDLLSRVTQHGFSFVRTLNVTENVTTYHQLPQ